MGKRKETSDFNVDSNSRCFICFEKVSKGLISVHSLQYLSQYLTLDMRKVFNEEELIPAHLLAQVQKSRLRVELCDDCGQLNEAFTRQLKHLQKIEMEVKSSLEIMHRKFQAAMVTNKTLKSQDLITDSDDFNGKIKMEIANALRTETMWKCRRKLGRPSPLVRIHRMSKRQVMANQARNKLNPFSKANNEKCVVNLNLSENLAKIKEEVSVLQPNQNDIENAFLDDSHSCTSGLDNTDCETMTTDDTTALTSTVKEEVDDMRLPRTGECHFVDETRTLQSTSHAVAGKNYIINPETGKLKCKFCSMEFTKPIGFGYHYRSIHLRIKYKCKLCKKEFSHRPSYNRHHKTAHLKKSHC